MKNSLKSRAKKSKIELQTNTYIIMTVLIQFLLCILAGVYTNLWQQWIGTNRYPYMEFGVGVTNSYSLAKNCFISVLIWFILLMNFVSISLLVTLEMVKFA